MPGETAARVGTVSALVLALAVLACAAVGLTETQHKDSSLAAEQHAALQAALGEMHAVFAGADHIDVGQLKLIERRAGLDRFEIRRRPYSRWRSRSAVAA